MWRRTSRSNEGVVDLVEGCRAGLAASTFIIMGFGARM